MVSTYTDQKIVDLAFIAGRILQGDGIYYSWTELKMVAGQLSQTENNITPTALAQFYTNRA